MDRHMQQNVIVKAIHQEKRTFLMGVAILELVFGQERKDSPDKLS